MSFNLGTAGLLALGSLALTEQGVNAAWGFGFCDPFGPTAKENFDLSRYAGNWYVIKKDNTVWYD